MREISTGKVTFRISESIKELPIGRFSDFQKYILQDSGIGSTIEGVMAHFEKLDLFISTGRIAEAGTERINQHLNFFMMLNSINIQHITFACLVDSINGKEIEDYSETNLRAIVVQLASLPQHLLEEILFDVKKNLIRN